MATAGCFLDSNNDMDKQVVAKSLWYAKVSCHGRGAIFMCAEGFRRKQWGGSDDGKKSSAVEYC